MGLIRKCIWLKLYHRHVKKIILIGGCLGFALIILKIDALFGAYNNTQLSDLLDDHENHKKNLMWMELMACRMENRRKKLNEMCQLYHLDVRGNDSLHRPNAWEFLINRPFHLVWCNVFKAASTSWLYNFNILAGYTPRFLHQTKEVPIELARKKYERPTLESLETALNDSISFLIVRHPFERLLSAFRDKMKSPWPKTEYEKISNFIIKKYRKEKEEKEFNIFNFFNFKKKPNRPKFTEFVKYVLDQYHQNQYIDMHWAPITNFCTPCQLRFDIIMKFETLQDDQNYLIKKNNLQDKIEPQWKNSNKGKRSVSVIKQYFSQLSFNQIYELYEFYKYDFHLFDYNLDEYVKYLDLNETLSNKLKATLEADRKINSALQSEHRKF